MVLLVPSCFGTRGLVPDLHREQGAEEVVRWPSVKRAFHDIQMTKPIVQHDVIVGFEDGYCSMVIKTLLGPHNRVGSPTPTVVVEVTGRGFGHRQLPHRIIAVHNHEQFVIRLLITAVGPG